MINAIAQRGRRQHAFFAFVSSFVLYALFLRKWQNGRQWQKTRAKKKESNGGVMKFFAFGLEGTF
jgi:hypothetical protein